MIPKIVHRVWMSDELPDKDSKIGQCFYSQEKLKDYGYEIRTYNAKNFDCSISKFLLQAYALKKWAYATDYIRIWTLYNYGGIYMDGDVEVIKPFDELLDLPYFCGAKYIKWGDQEKDPGKRYPHITGIYGDYGCTFDGGVFGFEKHSPILKLILDFYDNSNFIEDDYFIHDKSYCADNFTEDYIEHKITDVLVKNGYKRYLVDDLENYRKFLKDPNSEKSLYVLNTQFLCDANYHRHEDKNWECICIHYGLGSWIDRGAFEKRDREKLTDYPQEEQDEYFKRYENYTFNEDNNIYGYDFKGKE